ncbi:hypothetical protein GCM10023310_50720 [Paenibacillus vulneris]|uniref:Tail fiber protein n=1 Tax=Paenibacillus vulneris TaxID=1133364 RepID=A0ABW3UJQ9_9BACL
MTYNAKTNWKFEEIVTEHDMNRLEQGIKDAHAEGIDSPEPTALNLRYGTQVVQSDRVAPYNVTGFKGRTLVNLLGREGNYEYNVSSIATAGLTIAADTGNKVYGNQSLKMTLNNNTYGNIAHATNINDFSKSYLIVGDLKNGNSSTGLSLGFIAYNADLQFVGSKMSSVVSNTTGFSSSYALWAGNDFQNTAFIDAVVTITGANGQYGYVDGLRVYEITVEERNAIKSGTLSVDELAAKYPYVDDMKSITNPYVVKYGENLLPPFNEWDLHANATITEPYRLTLNSTASGQRSGYKFTPVNGQKYTLSLTNFTSNMNIYVEFNDARGNLISAPNLSDLPAIFVAPNNTASATIWFDCKAAGMFIFDRPLLNLGDTVKPFKPREDNYLFFPSQWCSNVDGSVADQLYRRGSDYYKFTKFKTLDLDGSLDWTYFVSQVGFKLIKATIKGAIGSNIDLTTHTAVKYDGKILKSVDSPGVNAASDRAYLDGNSLLYLSVADTDSGWGEGYTPSQDEMQAYFYGWVMGYDDNGTFVTPYNGSGSKRWRTIADKSSGGISTLPTTAAGSWYVPYKLQYQLAQPVLEKIIPEGEITLHEGLNQIEVGNGMIVREKVSSVYVQSDNAYYINRSDLGNLLKNKINRLVSLNRGVLNDTSYIYYPSGVIGILLPNYDPLAAYTVTYLALDQYSLTCNIQAMQGQYDANLKTNVGTLSKSHADIVKRVSVLETTKAGKVKSQWITPTLLNGWSVETSVGYMKDELGYVHLKGRVTGGPENTDIFILPSGYRPTQYIIVPVIMYDGTNYFSGRATVYPWGMVRFIGSKLNWNSLDGVIFLAEQ